MCNTRYDNPFVYLCHASVIFRAVASAHTAGGAIDYSRVAALMVVAAPIFRRGEYVMIVAEYHDNDSEILRV